MITDVFASSQLCNTCNAQLSNITKDGHVAATSELKAQTRATLAGVEYFFSELAPHLDGQRGAALVAALAQHATTWGGRGLAAALRARPWSHASAYTAAATGDALKSVLLALRVAQLEGQHVNFSSALAALGRRQGARRWQAHQALQPWCVALRGEAFIEAAAREAREAASRLVSVTPAPAPRAS